MLLFLSAGLWLAEILKHFPCLLSNSIFSLWKGHLCPLSTHLWTSLFFLKIRINLNIQMQSSFVLQVRQCVYRITVCLLSLIKISVFLRCNFFVITSSHRSLIDVLIFAQSRHSFSFQNLDKYSFLTVYSSFMLWFNKNNSLICLGFVSAHDLKGSFPMTNQLSQCNFWKILFALYCHILNIPLYWDVVQTICYVKLNHTRV